MKKILALLLAVVMVLGMVACASKTEAPAETTTTEPAAETTTEETKTEEPAKEEETATEEQPTEEGVIKKVALVTDVGTIDDESFNQATWQGVKAYCEANGIEYTYYQPTEDSTDARCISIDQAIKEGANVVVMPGYLFGGSIVREQEKYPEVYFIAVDVGAGDLTEDYATFYDPQANVVCATFAEEQAGYLAGYAVVMDGYTKLGFLGGMAVPAVQRYGYGFVQGVDAAAAELKLTDVKVNYAYGNQFFGDAVITAAMDTWYAGGTEIVFACGGGIYTSAVDAAKKVEGAKVIGVDVDQAAVIANYAAGEGADAATVEGYKALTVTSAMKGLYPATFDTLTDVIVNGNWEKYVGKIETLGLVSGTDPEANYVQIPMGDGTQWSDSFTQDDYKAMVKDMFDGKITVSNNTSSDVSAADFATVITVDDQGSIKG